MNLPFADWWEKFPDKWGGVERNSSIPHKDGVTVGRYQGAKHTFFFNKKLMKYFRFPPNSFCFTGDGLFFLGNTNAKLGKKSEESSFPRQGPKYYQSLLPVRHPDTRRAATF